MSDSHTEESLPEKETGGDDVFVYEGKRYLRIAGSAKPLFLQLTNIRLIEALNRSNEVASIEQLCLNFEGKAYLNGAILSVFGKKRNTDHIDITISAPEDTELKTDIHFSTDWQCWGAYGKVEVPKQIFDEILCAYRENRIDHIGIVVAIKDNLWQEMSEFLDHSTSGRSLYLQRNDREDACAHGSIVGFNITGKALLTENYQSSLDNPLDTEFTGWCELYDKRLKERHEGFALRSRLWAGECIGNSILSWCRLHNETPFDMSCKLQSVEEFVEGLYQALTPRDNLNAKQRYVFWVHLDIAKEIYQGRRSYRDGLLNKQRLKNLADEYLKSPWRHHSYIDWVFVDSLMAGELAATYEWFQGKLGGLAYALFEKNKLKVGLFKLMTTSFAIFFDWVLPGLFCWWLYTSFPRASLIIGSIYYISRILWLGASLCRIASHRFWGGKSLRQTATEINTSLLKAYDELREDTVHVPSLRRAVEKAVEKDVVWDPQLLCMIDNVAQKNPSRWIVSHDPNWIAGDR